MSKLHPKFQAVPVRGLRCVSLWPSKAPATGMKLEYVDPNVALDPTAPTEEKRDPNYRILSKVVQNPQELQDLVVNLAAGGFILPELEFETAAVENFMHLGQDFLGDDGIERRAEGWLHREVKIEEPSTGSKFSFGSPVPASSDSDVDTDSGEVQF